MAAMVGTFLVILIQFEFSFKNIEMLKATNESWSLADLYGSSN